MKPFSIRFIGTSNSTLFRWNDSVSVTNNWWNPACICHRHACSHSDTQHSLSFHVQANIPAILIFMGLYFPSHHLLDLRKYYVTKTRITWTLLSFTKLDSGKTGQEMLKFYLFLLCYSQRQTYSSFKIFIHVLGKHLYENIQRQFKNKFNAQFLPPSVYERNTAVFVINNATCVWPIRSEAFVIDLWIVI